MFGAFSAGTDSVFHFLLFPDGHELVQARPFGGGAMVPERRRQRLNRCKPGGTRYWGPRRWADS